MEFLFHPLAALGRRRRRPGSVPTRRLHGHQLEEQLMLKIQETKSTLKIQETIICSLYLCSGASLLLRFSSTVLSGVGLRWFSTFPMDAASGTVVPLFIRWHRWSLREEGEGRSPEAPTTKSEVNEVWCSLAEGTVTEPACYCTTSGVPSQRGGGGNRACLWAWPHSLAEMGGVRKKVPQETKWCRG